MRRKLKGYDSVYATDHCFVCDTEFENGEHFGGFEASYYPKRTYVCSQRCMDAASNVVEHMLSPKQQEEHDKFRLENVLRRCMFLDRLLDHHEKEPLDEHFLVEKFKEAFWFMVPSLSDALWAKFGEEVMERLDTEARKQVEVCLSVYSAKQ